MCLILLPPPDYASPVHHIILPCKLAHLTLFVVDLMCSVTKDFATQGKNEDRKPLLVLFSEEAMTVILSAVR